MNSIACTICTRIENIQTDPRSTCSHYYCNECYANIPQNLEYIPDCASCYTILFTLPESKNKSDTSCVKCKKKKKLLKLCLNHRVCKKCWESTEYYQVIEQCDICKIYNQHFCRRCLVLCKSNNRISNPNHPIDTYCISCFNNEKAIKCDECRVLYRKPDSSSCRICKRELSENKQCSYRLCKDHFLCNPCYTKMKKVSESHMILILRCPACIVAFKDRCLSPPPVKPNPPKLKRRMPSENFQNYCVICIHREGTNGVCGEHYICDTCFNKPPSKIPRELRCDACISHLVQWFPNIKSIRKGSKDAIKVRDEVNPNPELEYENTLKMERYLSNDEKSLRHGRTMNSFSTEEVDCSNESYSKPMAAPRHEAGKGSRSDIQCAFHGPTREVMECGHPMCIYCISQYFLRIFRGFIEDIIRKDIERLNKEDYTINCYNFPTCYNKACIPFDIVKDTALSVLIEQNIHTDFADYFSLNFEGIKSGFYLCIACGNVKDYSNNDQCWVCQLEILR